MKAYSTNNISITYKFTQIVIIGSLEFKIILN